MIKEEFSNSYTKKEIFEDLDITTLGGSPKVYIVKSKELIKFNSISVQVSYKGLTGTLDGTLKLMQSNDDSLPFVDIPTLTMTLSSAEDSGMLETSEFLGERVAVSLSKGSLTGGTVTAVLIAKNKN